MFSNKLNYRVINLAALMLLFYISISNIGMWLSLFRQIIIIIFPILFAFILAYSLYPLVVLLKQKRLSKILATVIIVLCFTLLLTLIISKSLPVIYKQIILFSKYLLTFIDQFSIRFNFKIGPIKLHLIDYLNNIISQLSNILGKSTIAIFNKSVNFIIKILTGYVFFVYFLWNMDVIRNKIKNFSLQISLKLHDYLKTLDNEINNYIKGLVISMLIQLLEYSILFLLVGHPNWLLLGILASLSNIIPYIGALFTNILGIIIAINVSSQVLIGTILVCLICPIIDTYLVVPKIYKKTNDINPFLVIVLMSISSSFFGLIGIVIGIPIYLLLRSTYIFLANNYKKYYKNKDSSYSN